MVADEKGPVHYKKINVDLLVHISALPYQESIGIKVALIFFCTTES